MPWVPGWAGEGRGETAVVVLVLTPPSIPLAGDESSDLIRHFLIESSAKGVYLKGASEELYFGKDGAITLSSPGSPRTSFQKPLEAPARSGAAPEPCRWRGGPPAPGSCPCFSASKAVIALSKTRTWGGGWKTHFCHCEAPNSPA